MCSGARCRACMLGGVDPDVQIDVGGYVPEAVLGGDDRECRLMRATRPLREHFSIYLNYLADRAD